MGPTRLCVMCEGVLTSELELTKESFQPTLTLERALEMLSKGTSIPKFDTKILFNVLTSLEGSSICCSCSAILNSGLQVTAQILLLESRLKNLGARIWKSAAITRSFESHQQIRKSQRNNSHPDFSFSKLFSESSSSEDMQVPVVPAPKKRKGSKHEDTESSTKTTSNGASRGKDSKRITESSEKPQKENPSVNKSTRKSPRGHKRSHATATPEITPSIAIKQRRPHPPGVQHCPSCDFSTDVRSPSEAEAFGILPLSVREALRKKSHRLLVQHFMDAHLPTSAKENFERRKSDGIKTYFCSESNCPYKTHLLRDLTRHFMGHHVCPPPDKPSSLSCPEKKCSCSIKVGQKSGIQDKNSLRYAQDQLAAHIFRDHDIPSHSSLKEALVKNSKFALLADVVKDSEHRKAYCCSRCDYEDLLPKRYPKSQYLSSRNAFLRHFYDAHLRSS